MPPSKAQPNADANANANAPGRKSRGQRSAPTARKDGPFPHQAPIVVPAHSEKRFYGHGIPNIKSAQLTGKLVVVEGADGSGRSTQMARLVEWLEGAGHATVQVGLKRSTLVSAELDSAQQGNILSRTTLSLFYATDFADQLENTILPMLRAGFIVLADRYIYTLMARDLVRGMDEAWLRNLYSIALVPDAVFYLKVPPEKLVQRNFSKNQTLDYWESGMDLGLARELFDSFLKYQECMSEQFQSLQSTYGFTIIDGEQPVETVTRELRSGVEALLKGPPSND